MSAEFWYLPTFLAALPLIVLVVWLLGRFFPEAPPANESAASRPATFRGIILVSLGFTTFYVLFLSHALFTGTLLAGGDNELYLPYVANPWSVWDPLLGCGYPRLGDPQCWTWYPPAILFGWLGWWNGLVLSTYIMASSFTFGLVWRLTGSKLAATVSALIYGLSGYMVSHQVHMVLIQAAAHIPLVIWALEELRHRISGKWIGILAVASAGTLLGGQPQVFVQAMLVAGLFVLAGFWRVPVGSVRYLVCTGLGLSLGIGLTAVQLLPTLELMPLSTRHEIDFGTFVYGSLPLAHLPLFVFPYGYGQMTTFGELGYWLPWLNVDSPEYLGSRTLQLCLVDVSGYVGCLGLLFAGLGAVAGPRDRWPRFWLLIALLSLAAAVGPDLPLAQVLFHVPGFNKFRCQGRNLIVTTLAVTVLAGYGLAWLQALTSRQRAVPLALATVGLVALWIAAWAALAYQMENSPTFQSVRQEHPDSRVLSPWPWDNPAIGLPLLNLAICLGVLWIWHVFRCRKTDVLLLAAVILDMGSFAWLSDWHYAMDPEEFQLPAYMAPLQQKLADNRQRLLLSIFNVNPSANWQVENAYVYSQLKLRRHAELMDEDVSTLVPDVLAVRFAAVEWGSFSPSKEHWKSLEDPPVEHALSCEGHAIHYRFALYENLHEAPRVRLVSRTVVQKPEDIVKALRSGRFADDERFDPLHTALVEEDGFRMEAGTDPSAHAEILANDATRVTVKTHARTETFLVLANVHYPGWCAAVDGEATPIAMTNYVVQGVRVPPGDHDVVFEFRSPTLRAGLAISVGCALVVLLLCVWKGRHVLAAVE